MTRARDDQTLTLEERRAAIAKTRGRISGALAAAERRVAGAFQNVTSSEPAAAASTGLASLVSTGFTLAIQARRLRRLIPVRLPVAIGVLAAGAAALGWFESRSARR